MQILSVAFSNIARASLTGIACLLAVGYSNAQEYPIKPIRMIVPVVPGSTADLVARIMSPGLAQLLEQSVVIENKPGAEHMLAYEYVAKQAPADGYTIATVQTATLAVLPVIQKNLRFDPLKDLPPFMNVVETVTYFGSAAKVPWRTFHEMVAYAKANQGKLNYAYPSAITRLKMEMLFQGLGLNVVPIGYKGLALPSILNGEVQFGVVSSANVTAAGNRFKVLAVSGVKRQPSLPNVPTFTELGFPQIQGGGFSFNLRAGTTQSVIAKLHSVSAKALLLPDIKDKFKKADIEIVGDPPDVSMKSLIEEARMYADIAKTINLE